MMHPKKKKIIIYAIVCVGMFLSSFIGQMAYGKDIWEMRLVKPSQNRSLRYNRVNVRVGPGNQYPVKFVFVRRGVPVRVVATYGYWDKIVDMNGDEGWVDRALLSSVATAIITSPVVNMYSEQDHHIVAKLAKGYVVVVDHCGARSCQVHASSYQGIVDRKDLWGDLSHK